MLQLWRPIFSLILLILGGNAQADDGSPLDQGMELYQDLARQALDDPALAKENASRLLQNEPQSAPSAEWLQAYLYMLTQHTEALAAPLIENKRIEEAIKAAQNLKMERLALQLSYQRERLEMQNAKVNLDEWKALHDKYLALAEARNFHRLATLIAAAKSHQAYNAGDMETALSITQQAIQRLEKHAAPQDIQMLVLRINSAMYLEYSNARDKAIEIYQGLIEDFSQLNLRWGKSDVYFNYGLALINAGRFLEAQDAFRMVQSTGKALNSALLQGRALKGLGYAQQKIQDRKGAIKTYKEAIVLMQAAHEDPVAVADTYKLLAMVYNAEKQYKDALTALEIAEREPTAMLDKVWEKSLQQERVEALAGLGQTDEALRYSRRLNAVLIGIMDDERKQELNRLKVSLGLELEEQKNKLLTEQNRVQDEKLRNAEMMRRFFFGFLALFMLVILLLGIALVQTLKAKRSRERAHRILEHIEEGILSIGVGMKVEADLSPYLARLLGFDQHSMRSLDVFEGLLEKADLKADERATIRAALNAIVGEDALNWDMNQTQLPWEATIQNGSRHLSLEWQPIYDDAQRVVQNVLLTVRDITARRALQNEVAQVRAHATRMEQRLADILQIEAGAAESFLREAQKILPELRPRFLAERELLFCCRQLHTFKGLARSLGFKELSTLVHELEDQVDIKSENLKPGHEALRILDEMETAVRDYQEIIEKVYLRPGAAVGSQDKTLWELVASNLAPVRRLLENAGLELAGVNVHDHVQEWNREQLDVVRLLLLHGMTNSADHGFVLPRRKGLEVSDQAMLTIKAWRSKGSIHLELSDNGVGIDWARIGKISEELGFVPAADETLADVVFLDGTSTADEVSISSGRGMGLAALKQSIVARNGSIHFKPNPTGQGSCLLVSLPFLVAKAA